MRFWKIVLLAGILYIGHCVADQHFHVQRDLRPERPSKFTSEKELEKYLDKLREYIAKSGPKYGKRFAPMQYDQYEVESPSKQMDLMYNVVNDYSDDY